MTSDHEIFLKQEAKKFVTQLMQTIFADKKIELLEQFYTDDVVGHYEDELFYLQDIRNRVIALKNNTKNFRFNIEDLFLIDDLIIFCVKQNWLDTKDYQFNDSLVFGVYRIRNKKVCELWLSLDRKVSSYKAVNVQFKEEMQSFEVNEKNKQEFLQRLASVLEPTRSKNTELTKVEQECLYYYFHGFSAKETAVQMSISFRTVQAYIANIKDRFSCDTKIELRKRLFAHLAKK